MLELIPENSLQLNRESRRLLVKARQDADPSQLYSLQLMSWALGRPGLTLRPKDRPDLQTMVERRLIEKPDVAMRYLTECDSPGDVLVPQDAAAGEEPGPGSEFAAAGAEGPDVGDGGRVSGRLKAAPSIAAEVLADRIMLEMITALEQVMNGATDVHLPAGQYIRKFCVLRLYMRALDEEWKENRLPKLLGDASAVTHRRAELRAPHIAPLTEFVEELRAEAGPRAQVPYFDPWDGGIEATTLFLLEAPGPKAIRSGFVSRNNPDETAKNFFELSVEARIDRKKTVIWNVVPWYIGDGRKIRAAMPKDLEAGLVPLLRLLDLLPRLNAVVLFGRKAEKAFRHLDRERYAVITSPHPSPLFVNNSPGNRGKILAALRQLGSHNTLQPNANSAMAGLNRRRKVFGKRTT